MLAANSDASKGPVIANEKELQAVLADLVDVKGRRADKVYTYHVLLKHVTVYLFSAVCIALTRLFFPYLVSFYTRIARFARAAETVDFATAPLKEQIKKVQTASVVVGQCTHVQESSHTAVAASAAIACTRTHTHTNTHTRTRTHTHRREGSVAERRSVHEEEGLRCGAHVAVRQGQGRAEEAGGQSRRAVHQVVQR